MSLIYKGKSIIRILSLGDKIGGKPMYFVETSDGFSVVPEYMIGADDGVSEVIRVANRTRGNLLQENA